VRGGGSRKERGRGDTASTDTADRETKKGRNIEIRLSVAEKEEACESVACEDKAPKKKTPLASRRGKREAATASGRKRKRSVLGRWVTEREKKKKSLPLDLFGVEKGAALGRLVEEKKRVNQRCGKKARGKKRRRLDKKARGKSSVG